jgi:RNA polymerase sigma factor (sigma-70 family)
MPSSGPSDSADFRDFLAPHRRLIDAVVARVCRHHRSLASDARQEVHLALWRRRRTGPAIVHAVSYVYRVARNAALGVLRRHRWPEPPPLLPHAGRHRPGALLPEERGYHLHQLLGRLPPDQARAVAAYLAGFRHQEIAAWFGWSEPAARHRLYAALAAVKAWAAEDPAGARPRAEGPGGPSSRP